MLVNIGKNIELEVVETKFNDEVMKHIFYIGIRNVLMDSHAGVNAKASPELTAKQVQEQSKAAALKKLDALYRGEIRVAGTRSSSIDPIELEMKRIAIKLAQDIFRKAGKKLSSVTSDELLASVNKILEEKDAQIRKVATNFVKDRESLAI